MAADKSGGGEAQAELAKIAAALARIEAQLAPHFAPPDARALDRGACWRWQTTAYGAQLLPLPLPQEAALDDLVGLDEHIAAVEKNTRQFLGGRAANHVLLTGARGCGKSTLIRGVFEKYRRKGLRLIETDAAGIARLPLLQPLLAARKEKYILYCDDLSFQESDQLFSRIKSAVDGALTSTGGNLLLYATSNRRNLIAEKFSDNLPPLAADDIQPQETIDEKTALTDRFGLWLHFYPPDAEEYEAMVKHWLKRFGVRATAAVLQDAVNFADQRGSRNGRVARQFVVGKIG